MTKLAQWKTTALITGASSGIGLELSRLFAKDGYNLILVARSAQKLQALADELEREYGVAVTVLPADLSQAGAAREIYRRVQEKGIQVEALVNNAGFGVLEVLANAHLEDSLEMIQLNVTSLTVITQLFLPDMIQGRSGRILNVGSTGSFSPRGCLATGRLATAAHWILDVIHQLGYAWAASHAGYPMIGIRRWWVLSICLYPNNEPELPKRIHMQRALGGPAWSW